MLRFSAVFVLVVFGVASSQHTFAAVNTSTSVADAFVAASNPNNNYGGAGGLAVAAVGLPNGDFESLLRFDTAAAKAQFDTAFGAGQWHVTNVVLRLTATSPNNPIFNTQAAGQFSVNWAQNDSWVEGTGSPNMASMVGLTYATFPSFLSSSDQALGSFAFDGSTSGANNYALTVTTGVQNDIQAGGLLGLHVEPADSSISYVFHARNFGAASDRPMLSITAVSGPVPAVSTWGMVVFALFLTIAGTLILRRENRTVSA